MPYDQDTMSYMSNLCHADLRQHVSCTQRAVPNLEGIGIQLMQLLC